MGALADSRAVLRDYGNMSSATVMFVLARLLARAGPARTGLRAGLRPRADGRGDALSHRRRRMSWDVAVAGGGLAGAAAASRLALAGRRVVLFERERGPHDKVCGEFLSGEAAAELTALGLSARPAWVPCRSSACVSSRAGSTAARDRCRSPPGASRAAGWTSWLLARRRAVASTVRRGQRCAALEADGDGVRLRCGDGVSRGRGGAPRHRQARAARLAAARCIEARSG